MSLAYAMNTMNTWLISQGASNIGQPLPAAPNDSHGVTMAAAVYKVHQEKLTSINQAPDSMVSNADALNPQQLALRAYFVEPSRNIGLYKMNSKNMYIICRPLTTYD